MVALIDTASYSSSTNLFQIGQIFELQSDENYKSRRRRDTLQPYRSDKEMSHDIRNALFHEPGVVFVEISRTLIRKPRGFNPSSCCDNFNDPEYPNQWFYVSLLYIIITESIFNMYRISIFLINVVGVLQLV